MSHIHLPDGIIPFIWWFSGFIIALLIAGLVLKLIKTETINRKIPIAAVMAAVMLVTMSIPLGFIPFHLNLSAFSGILMGPAFGFLLAFVVNLFMALMGHGGFTVVGLNTIIIGIEAIIAYFIYSVLSRKMQKSLSAGISVALALIVSISLMISVVGFSGAIELSAETTILDAGHDHEHDEEKHVEEEYHEKEHAEGISIGFIALTGWTAFFAVVISGIVLESILTALIVGFLAKVRPDMIETKYGITG